MKRVPKGYEFHICEFRTSDYLGHMQRPRSQRPFAATRHPRVAGRVRPALSGNGELHEQVMMIPKRPHGRGARTVWFQWFDGAGELQLMALNEERSRHFLRVAH